MPITASPPPESKTPRTRTAKPTAPSATDQTAARAQGLQGWGQIGQAILIGLHQYSDAGAIGLYFDPLAGEIAKLATADERIAKIVDPIIQTGPYSALIAAALPLAMQLAVNHGRMKPGALGTVPRETLSARIEAAIARQQAEAFRAQQEAEQEAERLQEEIRQSKAVVPSRVTT